MLNPYYWTSSVKNPRKVSESFLTCFNVFSWDTTQEYPPKTLLFKGHENGKPMKYLWKGAKYNQLELPWKTYEIISLNEIYGKAMKFISLKWDLWKTLPSNQPYEKAMKIDTLQPPPWKNHENWEYKTKVVSIIPWVYFPSTIVSPNMFRPTSSLLGWLFLLTWIKEINNTIMRHHCRGRVHPLPARWSYLLSYIFAKIHRTAYIWLLLCFARWFKVSLNQPLNWFKMSLNPPLNRLHEAM